jgi:hypothetical protein
LFPVECKNEIAQDVEDTCRFGALWTRARPRADYEIEARVQFCSTTALWLPRLRFSGGWAGGRKRGAYC